MILSVEKLLKMRLLVLRTLTSALLICTTKWPWVRFLKLSLKRVASRIRLRLWTLKNSAYSRRNTLQRFREFLKRLVVSLTGLITLWQKFMGVLDSCNRSLPRQEVRLQLLLSPQRPRLNQEFLPRSIRLRTYGILLLLSATVRLGHR